MNTKQTMGFSTFSTTRESEIRYEVSLNDLKTALESGAVKIRDRMEISQKWIINQDKCHGRIRKTKMLLEVKENICGIPFGKYAKLAEELQHGECCVDEDDKFFNVYEHTVKHSFEDQVDLEVTTVLSMVDFELLDKLYEDLPMQNKARLILTDKSNEYNDYIISADIPSDKENVCWIEFESMNGMVSENFKKPEWIKNYDEKRAEIHK